jgi:hypothetical protein
MNVEEDHLDMLQNMEFGIIQVYQSNPDLIDAEVLAAIDALVRIYGAEAQGKTISSRPVRGIAKQVMEAVQELCEWRLGRQALTDASQPFEDIPALSLEVIVACLKRIQSSIKFWTQKGGRQGYLNYVLQFMK